MNASPEGEPGPPFTDSVLMLGTDTRTRTPVHANEQTSAWPGGTRTAVARRHRRGYSRSPSDVAPTWSPLRDEELWPEPGDIHFVVCDPIHRAVGPSRPVPPQAAAWAAVAQPSFPAELLAAEQGAAQLAAPDGSKGIEAFSLDRRDKGPG